MFDFFNSYESPICEIVPIKFSSVLCQSGAGTEKYIVDEDYPLF